MKSHLTKRTVAIAAAASLTLSTQALTIGSPERIATLDLATAGQTGAGNPLVNDIANEFASAQPWTLRGNVASGASAEDLLTINLTGGTWGSGSASGTWSLASSFWSTYGSAVISIHVGNGGGDPDHFSFLLAQGATTGTWSYQKISGGGGGLSNLRLFATESPTPNDPPSVPDGGSTLLLLAAGIGALELLRLQLARSV